MQRERVSSGTKWEGFVGYSRAVKVGSTIHVSGTTATGADGEIVGRDDPYRQAQQTIDNIEAALVRLGASLDDVVRTRIYVVKIDQWQEIGRAHGERFGAARPASTMVEVSRLVDPTMLVEIEVEAFVSTA